MAVALPNGNTDGVSGKVKAATLASSLPTFVFAVVAVALGHVKLFGGLDPSVQYFIESALVTLVVSGVTYLASYFAKHANPVLLKAVEDSEHVIWDQAAYEAAKKLDPSHKFQPEPPAESPPTE
jgi:hypothetical protein